MTGKAQVFATIRDVLDRRGVDWAVLHGADQLPDGWRNDLDVWVDERFDDVTLNEVMVQLQRVGHPVVQSFESAVGTRALWCDPRGGSPIQLDFSRQILVGTSVRVMSATELRAAVDRTGPVPTLDAAGSFLYLLAKRLEKGIEDARALAELRSAAARAGEDSARRIARRLLGERAAGLDAALAAGLPGANAWLRARRRAFFLRMMAVDPLGFLDVQAHNATRLVERLVRPGGLVVESADAVALRNAVAADLEGVFRSVVASPHRPSIDLARNRLVVAGARSRRWSGSRMYVPSTCGDAADRIASVQVGRVARRHHATSSTSLPVLCYHAVGLDPARRRGGKVRWEIDPARLAGDLDALTAAGYQVRSLAAHDPGGGPQVVLTIDDGNATDLDVVLPMLRARAMTATFFVPTRRVGEDGYLDRCRRAPARRCRDGDRLPRSPASPDDGDVRERPTR